jgi:hypothetical protein
MYAVCLCIIKEEMIQEQSYLSNLSYEMKASQSQKWQQEFFGMNDIREMLLKKEAEVKNTVCGYEDILTGCALQKKFKKAPVLLLGPPSTHGGNKNANTTDLTYRTKAYL